VSPLIQPKIQNSEMRDVKQCHIDGFLAQMLFKSSTADTHLVILRSGFLWQEAALPQLPISQIGIHHTKFLQSQKIIPTEMWPKNQFMNLLTP
jgi:hypothetical protein